MYNPRHMHARAVFTSIMIISCSALSAFSLEEVAAVTDDWYFSGAGHSVKGSDGKLIHQWVAPENADDSTSGGLATAPPEGADGQVFRLKSGLPGATALSFFPSAPEGSSYATADLDAATTITFKAHSDGKGTAILRVKITRTDENQPEVGTGKVVRIPLEWTGWQTFEFPIEEMMIEGASPGDAALTRQVSFHIDNDDQAQEAEGEVFIADFKFLK